jgi:acetyl esterase/lipase
VLSYPAAPDAVELRHLRAFVAVAGELNFGRAAERLYITQPALSRQIRALEKALGCELLRRTTHRVELTLAGEALLDRSHEVLRGVDEAVAAAQSVGGELTERVERLWAPLAGLDDLGELRAAYEALHAEFSPPPECAVRSVLANGVPSLAVVPPGADVRMLYLHGGGFVMGSAYGYRHLAGALATSAGLGALVPDYRLAPEHPFPAALDDAVRAYRHLAEDATVALAGDSSGCSLALGVMLRARAEGLPLPSRVVLFCPGVDPSFTSLAESDVEGAEEMLTRSREVLGSYLAGHPLDDPLVSPLNADLTGLPPVLIQAAEGDLALGDALSLETRLRESGVAVTLEPYFSMTHAFQMFWSFLPEAVEALASAGRFLKGG